MLINYIFGELVPEAVVGYNCTCTKLLVKLLAYFLINNGMSGFTSNTLLIENIGLK